MTDIEGPVVVTGAGGFIGGAVARHLARLNRPVRGGTRQGRPLGTGIDPVALDILSPDSLLQAFRGAAGVVHCAYGGRAETVTGTENVLRAAAACGVLRLVHLSSIAVYGAASGTVTEATPTLPPAGRGYAHWKAATEAACRASGLAGVRILRPGIVYGPGAKAWIDVPMRRVRQHGWSDLGAWGAGTAALVHVDDVAAACIAALGSPRGDGEAFNITGPETLSWADYYRRLAAAGRAALPARTATAWNARVLAGLPLRLLARAAPPLAPALANPILLCPSPSERRLFRLRATYPADKAQDWLGFRPVIGLAAGLADALGIEAA